ncbi:hypothetical protein [Xanthobacter tagetidis]|uniref:Uncharacterized protein n=1 Tax=Xanthobacter tagetidis TaxID=60216 RepID=A0A3L7A6P1_9HYPH|nr:hypothetical protein [Xanthobacter tagetidis]MBB6307294.1 hypothetical protein [Xanthobacter tagetidis]RLP75837.1 hypothetical protein D9R14_16230 [Xanthobacter tagetidis]
MFPLLKRIPAEDLEPIRGRPRKLFLEDRAPVNPTEVRLTQIRESYLSRLPGRHTPTVKEIAERIAAKQIEAEVTAALWGADHEFARRQEVELGRLIAALHLEHDEPLHPADAWPDTAYEDAATEQGDH